MLNYFLKVPLYNLPLITERTLIGSQHLEITEQSKRGNARYKLSPGTVS